MKKICFFANVLFLSLSSNAQISERLIMQVTELNDTLKYSYQPGLGSRFNYYAADYYTNNDPMQKVYNLNLPLVNPSNEMRTDTTWKNGAPLQTARYNSYAKMEEATIGPAANYLRYTSSFDGQGNIAEMFEIRTISIPNLSVDTLNRKRFYYNSNNQIVADTMFNVKNGSYETHAYKYNTLGQMIEASQASSTAMGDIYTFTYDNNSMVSTCIRVRNGNILSKDTIAYGGPLLRPILYDSYNWNTATQQFELAFLDHRHLDANGDIDSVFFKNGPATIQLVYTFKYNSNHNPVQRESFLNNAGTAYYYYEPYFATGVSNVKTEPKANMLVYPNPARDVLNIKWAEAKLGSELRFTLINMLGQPVYSESLTSYQTTEQLHIANLPAGSYRLIVRDKSGAAIYQQAIVK